MGKQKKHKEKKPEEDKNNVAYYKKKNATLEKEEPSMKNGDENPKAEVLIGYF